MGKEEAPEPVEKGGDGTSSKLSKILSSEINRQAEEWECENRKIASETSSNTNLNEYFTDPLVTTDPLTLPGNRDETIDLYNDQIDKNPKKYDTEKSEISMADKSKDVTDKLIETEVSYLDDLIADAELTSNELSSVKAINDSTQEPAISDGTDHTIPTDLIPLEESPSSPVSIGKIANDHITQFDQDNQTVVSYTGESNVGISSSDGDSVNKMFDIVNKDLFDKSIIKHNDETVPIRQNIDSLTINDDILLNSNDKQSYDCEEINRDKGVLIDNDNQVDNNDCEAQKDISEEAVEETKSLTELNQPDSCSKPELPAYSESSAGCQMQSHIDLVKYLSSKDILVESMNKNEFSKINSDSTVNNNKTELLTTSDTDETKKESSEIRTSSDGNKDKSTNSNFEDGISQDKNDFINKIDNIIPSSDELNSGKEEDMIINNTPDHSVNIKERNNNPESTENVERSVVLSEVHNNEMVDVSDDMKKVTDNLKIDSAVVPTDEESSQMDVQIENENIEETNVEAKDCNEVVDIISTELSSRCPVKGESVVMKHDEVDNVTDETSQLSLFKGEYISNPCNSIPSCNDGNDGDSIAPNDQNIDVTSKSISLDLNADISESTVEDTTKPLSDGENDVDKVLSDNVDDGSSKNRIEIDSSKDQSDLQRITDLNAQTDNYDLSMIKIEEMNLEDRLRLDSSEVVRRRKPDIYPNLLKSILRVNKNNGNRKNKLKKIEKIAEKLSAESGKLRPIAPKPIHEFTSKCENITNLSDILSSSLVQEPKSDSCDNRLRNIAPKPILESSSKSENTFKNSAEILALALGNSEDIPKITSAVEILRVDSPDAVRKKPDLTPSVSLIPAEISKTTHRKSNFSLSKKASFNSSISQHPLMFKKTLTKESIPIPSHYFNLSGVNIELRNVPAESLKLSQQTSRLSPSNTPQCLPNQMCSVPLSHPANFPLSMSPSQSLPSSVPLQRFCPPLSFNPLPTMIPQMIPRPHMNRHPNEHIIPHHKFIEAFYRTKSGVIKKKFVKVPFVPYGGTKISKVFPDGSSQISMVESSNPTTFSNEQPEILKHHPNADSIYPNSPVIPQPILSLMKQSEKTQPDISFSGSNLEMIPFLSKDPINLDNTKSRNSGDNYNLRSDNRTNGSIESKLNDEVPKRVLDALLHENKTETCKTDSLKTDKSIVTKSLTILTTDGNSSLVSATSSLLKLSKGTHAGSEEVVFNSNDLKVILVQPESELHSSKKGSLLPLCENSEKQPVVNNESQDEKTCEDQNIVYEGNPEKIAKKKKRGSLESVCEKLTMKKINTETPVQIIDITESIAPSKSPDIVLLPKSLADQSKTVESTDNSSDRSAQILKVPKFNVVEESNNISESNQFISLFSLSQRSLEKSRSTSSVNPVSGDSQTNNGSIPKSSSPTNIPQHGGRSGMVSRKSIGRKKVSDATDTVKKSRSRNSEILTTPPPHISDAHQIDGKRIILSDINKGCGGEVNVVEVSSTNSNDSANYGSASGQQEQQDAIHRLRMLGTDVSLEDQKVTKNLRSGDTVLVTPIEDGEHQPPAIKLLEDMAKSTELPVASPVLTALGQQNIKAKRKSQQNINCDPAKLPSPKETSTKVPSELLDLKQMRSNSENSNVTVEMSNGENIINVDNEKISDDSNKLPDSKVNSTVQSNGDKITKFQPNVLQSNYIVTRSSLQQNMKVVESDKKDLLTSTERPPSPSSNKVQKIATSPQNQKNTRSSVQQNVSQSLSDDKSDLNDHSVQTTLPQTNDKVQNQTGKSTRSSSVQNPLQLQIVLVDKEIKTDENNDINKSDKIQCDDVSEISPKKEANMSQKKNVNNYKNKDGIFLIRPQHYVKTVDGEQVWSCDICTVVCTQLSQFRKHYLRLHISPKFISEKDKEALNIIESDSDKDSKKIFKCHVCKDYFHKKLDLKIHLQNHPDRLDHAQTNKLLKQYVCPHCDAIFKWRKPLGKHKKMCQENLKNSSKPTHHCLYCNETFFTPYRKKNHILSSHPYTRKKHNCVFCNKIFLSNVTLFNHLVGTHSSVFFGCITCKERYMNLTELKAHFKKSHPTESLKVKNSSTNTVDKDFYRCNKCDRNFLIENCFNKHECIKNVEKETKEKVVKKVQKRIKPVTIEPKTETPVGPIGETEFYSKVSTNIRENLTYHLDGKLHPVEVPSNSVSSHRTILNFNAAVKPTAVPAPLPSQDKQTKSPSTPTYEKFNFPKEYDGRCGLTSFIKDASYLDISTQLIMRRNLQRLNLLPQATPDPQWDVPASLALERLGAQCAESFGIADPPQEENTSEESAPIPLGELSGEWVRERTYICSTCLWQSPCLWSMEDHKYSAHPHVWCPQHELNTPNHKQISSFTYRRLVGSPKEEKRERNMHPRLAKEKYECTKCHITDIRTKQDLHRHILECVGEDLAALELLHNAAVVRLPTGKKRSKWRGGSRRTRQGLKRNIPSTPPAQNSKRNKKLLRTKPGDADTIEKMIANLPAKRATRRVLGFDEIDIKTRSQATIQNSSTAPAASQTTKKTLKPSSSQTSPPKKKVQGIDTSAENGNVLSSLRMMPVVKKLDIPETTDSMPTLEIEEDVGIDSAGRNPEIPVLTPATSVSNQIVTPAGIPLPTPVLPPSTTAILLFVPPLQQQPPPLVPIQSNKDVKTIISEPNQICNISIIQGKVKLESLDIVSESQDKAQSKQVLNIPSPFPKINCKKGSIPPPELKSRKRGRPMGSKNKSKLNRVKKEELKKTTGSKKLRGWWLKEHSKDLKHSSSNKLKGWWLKELTQKAKSAEIEKAKAGTKKVVKKVVKKKDSPKKDVVVPDKVEVKEEPAVASDSAAKTDTLEKADLDNKSSPKQDGVKRRKRKSDPEEDKLKQEKIQQEKKRKLEEKRMKEEERLRKSAEKKLMLEKKKQEREEAKRMKEEKKKIDEAKKLEEDKKKKQAEEEKKKEEEEKIKKGQDEEKKRIEVEENKKKADEEKRKKEEEIKRKEEEKKKKEEEARKHKEEEVKRKEEEKKKRDEETKRRKEEEAKRKEEEKKRKEEEAKKRKEEEQKRKEEIKKRKEEEAKKRKEEETRRKEEERKWKEAEKKAEEERKRNEKEEAERLKKEEEERNKKEAEEKKLKEEEEKKRDEEIKIEEEKQTDTNDNEFVERNLDESTDKRSNTEQENCSEIEGAIEVEQVGTPMYPASGESSPLTDDSKFSDTDSQKNLKLKKRKKHMDIKIKKLNRLSLAQKIRRKRFMMKMKESDSSSSGKEVVSSGMKWEVEVSSEPERQEVVSTSESTSLPEEMDWLSGVTPPSTAVVKLVPTSTLLMDPMNTSAQQNSQSSIDNVSITPTSTQSSTGPNVDTFWRDTSFQTSSTPNLGSILDSVNTSNELKCCIVLTNE